MLTRVFFVIVAVVGIVGLVYWWRLPGKLGGSTKPSAAERVCSGEVWLLGLARSGNQEAKDVLVALADAESQKDSPDWKIANAAAVLEALRATDRLREMLKSDDRRVRCVAARSLGQLKDAAAVDDLKALLEDKTSVWMNYELPVAPGGSVVGKESFETTPANRAREALAQIGGIKINEKVDAKSSRESGAPAK